MNAFLTYDRIEDRRWVEQQLTDEKEKWIDDRAQELIALFPDNPLLNCSIFLPKEARYALLSDKAQEAYNDFISACAYARAEEEWQAQAPCPF